MKINLTKLIENSIKVIRFNYSEGTTDRYSVPVDPTQNTSPKSPYSFELEEKE